MTNKIRHKAKMLLIELESLRECRNGESIIETFNLLEEVLKDAGCLAKQVKNNIPGSLEERIAILQETSRTLQRQCVAVSERSKNARDRSKELLNRYCVFKY